VLNETYARRSARVLVVDATERVLLIESYHRPDDPDAGTYWMVPGGGVDPGESLAAAAARELREETGLAVLSSELGEPVAYTSGYAEFSWASGQFRDDLFLCRVDRHEVSITGLLDYERNVMIGHRWWTVAELAETTEEVIPLGLADLLADLLAGRVDTRPRQLPWHH
jgi:8-oxo-dGTP pyrophosphatase MutT (NUDIX family)